MSYERMKKREAELTAEVAGMLAAAEAADVQEDEIFGKDKRGDEPYTHLQQCELLSS